MLSSLSSRSMGAFILDYLNVKMRINNGSLTQMDTNNGSLLHRNILFELKKILRCGKIYTNNGSLFYLSMDTEFIQNQ